MATRTPTRISLCGTSMVHPFLSGGRQLPKIFDRFHRGLLRLAEHISFEDDALQFAGSRGEKYSGARERSAPAHDGIRASIQAYDRTSRHRRARRDSVEQQ